jgi:hypothetical protein
MTTKTHRPASHRGRRTRRKKSRADANLPVGITLYYYPRTKKLAPAIYDPELQGLARSCLARIRTILALRGSPTMVGIVLFDERQREGFWLGEDG